MKNLHLILISCFLIGLISFNKVLAQPKVFLAANKSSLPCQDPPCDPVFDFMHSNTDPANYQLGDYFISNCFDFDSTSGNAITRLQFILNPASLPAFKQLSGSYIYAIQLFANDMNGNPLPISSVVDSLATIQNPLSSQANNWYSMIHLNPVSGYFEGDIILEIDNSNNNVASGYISVEFQLGYRLSNSLANPYTLTGSLEQVMGGTRCQEGGINTLRQGIASTTQNAFDFSIVPNPTNGRFSVIFDSQIESHVEIKIYDMKGVLFYRKDGIPTLSSGKHRLNLDTKSFLTPGIYLVEIQSENQIKFEKLVIN